MHIISLKSKQSHIDELLGKLDNSSATLERLREEKDAEIQILQEGMDTTIQQLSEAQSVRHTRFQT
jgi:molecular chaperone GrpE (heat shock protein)